MVKSTVPVLYEDDACMVFDKPPGLLTIPAIKNEEHALVRLVNAQYNTQGALHPAHRLDRDTSGVILFAKGKANQRILMQAFKDKRVRKNYVAFVHGHVQRPEGKIRIPIKDFYQRKFLRHAPAQSALTKYKVRDYYKNFTVVDVMPVTGRTNQIRIHFAKIGHPLVGEDKYAFRKDFDLRFRRAALHAARLEWPHPVTGKMTAIESPLPVDMVKFLENNT
ncbi:MAG: RluA family pseudouridine synthase [Candidatus Omnitrophica bacterium]|nr:RluA family pseudouridine synthase [Candidatus Omnitrophota bacterium]